jgi:hypothetical protein
MIGCSVSFWPSLPRHSASPWQNGFAERLIGAIRRRRLLLKRLPVRKRGAVRTVFLTAVRFQAAWPLDLGASGLVVGFVVAGPAQQHAARDFATEGWPELCPVLAPIAGGLAGNPQEPFGA